MRLFILGKEIELKDAGRVAQTLQVNSIVSLSNRQSSFTNTFVATKSAKNISAFKYLGLPNNTSDVPYRKNECSLFSDTGECLIYKGWAVITELVNGDGYKINVYSGLIDFYKVIENKTLTDVGLADLNHIKNITSITDSFDDSKEYKYIIADYNGKLFTNDSKVNADYLVPSARVSYIMNRISEYSGFEFIGSVFSRADFLNLYMTYPKPVPTEEPIVNFVTDQDAAITTSYNDVFQSLVYQVVMLPNITTNTYIQNSQTILVSGSYRIRITGSLESNGEVFNKVNWSLYQSNGTTLVSTGVIDNTGNPEQIIYANAGERLYLQLMSQYGILFFSTSLITGTINSQIDFIVGYTASFDEALVDFSAKDFFDEIIQRFALTVIKNKYEKKLTFLTLEEILSNPDYLDWSNKFQSVINEKYIIGSYGRRNNFKYRHNDQNSKLNDGFIDILNENLPDEKTVVQSKIYTNEKEKSLIGSNSVNIYKIWEKEITDDGETKYKDLSGRYYFLRSENKLQSLQIKSEALNDSTTVSSFPIENYDRLGFNQIIFDNYKLIDGILNNAKIVTVDLWLKDSDIVSFAFDRLIFLEQTGKYFLVDKINNYRKGVKTRVDLIKVDYLSKLRENPSIDGTIIKADLVVSGCQITFTLDTDQTYPFWLNVIGSKDLFGGIPNPETDYFNSILYVNSPTFTITTPSGGNWSLILTLPNGITSIPLFASNIFTCVVTPPAENLTFITITSIEKLSVVNNVRKLKVNFNTDLPLPNTLNFQAYTTLFPFQDNVSVMVNATTNYVIVDVADIYYNLQNVALPISWSCRLVKGPINSNNVTSN